MIKIAVIHYLPIEFYPPTMNFLDIIGSKRKNKIKAWTTDNSKRRNIYFNNNIESISRALSPKINENVIVRILKYLLFNLNCFLGLIIYKPNKIIYYESYSAWPVYWYLLLFGKKTELFIHYHEYFSKEWYASGMKLVRLYHTYEKNFLYKKAKWISQTNEDRVRLFLKNNPEILKNKMKILPNFPPKSWQNIQKTKKTDYSVLKIVYVGSLSLGATYIKEFCEWVISQKGKVIFDIYAFNIDKTTTRYLNLLKVQHINFFENGIEYDNLPRILSNYDIGVILYKAIIDNLKFNAPNKLFEYLACGLQVWYSNKMLGIKPYESDDVLAMDFDNIDKFHPVFLMAKVKNISQNYFAEDALQELIFKLEKNLNNVD
jgi:hypothetical protein